jgi:hypothetical protein
MIFYLQYLLIIIYSIQSYYDKIYYNNLYYYNYYKYQKIIIIYKI